MKPELQRRVQRYGWDKASSCYERYWSRQLQPAHDCLLQTADLKPGERVFDVACGTGLITFPAADAVGQTGQVLGTDISDDMIVIAATSAAEAGYRNTTFHRADAEYLNLPFHAYDAALCALGLMYLPDPVAALRSVRRHLRRDGRMVAAVWGARDRCGWAEIFPIVESRVRSDVCPMFFQLGTGTALDHALTSAGYESVETTRISTVLRYDTADAALGAAFAGGPVALAYSRFDEATKRAAHAEYLESIDAFRHDDGYEIPGEFVIASGRNPAARPSLNHHRAIPRGRALHWVNGFQAQQPAPLRRKSDPGGLGPDDPPLRFSPV